MEIEEKLKKIEKMCKKDAKEQKEKIEMQVNSKIHEAIQEMMEDYRKRQSKKKQNILLKMEKEYNTNLWKLDQEFKQKSIEHRDIIINDLFNELKNKLIDFTNSEEYQQYLIKNINKTVSNFPERENLIIYVVAKDQSKVAHIYPNTRIMDDKFIGGCIIKNDNQSVNNTLLENLEEKIDEYKNNI